MTTRARLTQRTLAAEARRLSGDVDGARWALAELAAQAKAEGVAGWAAIIGAECRRAEDTVEKWALTWEWLESRGGPDYAPRLPYSFYECASKHSAELGNSIISEALWIAESDHTTYEAFRAQLSTLAGKEDLYGDFPAWAKRERKRILDRIDRAPSRRAGDCLRLAADALADALEQETSKNSRR